ncbi:hypothetical protein C8R44DRAFT_747592 [Mycena epipterygia]|nr:hypothetical protein C8R44DRAFT_747592 [Mycena epipterygia]
MKRHILASHVVGDLAEAVKLDTCAVRRLDMPSISNTCPYHYHEGRREGVKESARSSTPGIQRPFNKLELGKALFHGALGIGLSENRLPSLYGSRHGIEIKVPIITINFDEHPQDEVSLRLLKMQPSNVTKQCLMPGMPLLNDICTEKVVIHCQVVCRGASGKEPDPRSPLRMKSKSKKMVLEDKTVKAEDNCNS